MEAFVALRLYGTAQRKNPAVRVGETGRRGAVPRIGPGALADYANVVAWNGVQQKNPASSPTKGGALPPLQFSERKCKAWRTGMSVRNRTKERK